MNKRCGMLDHVIIAVLDGQQEMYVEAITETTLDTLTNARTSNFKTLVCVTKQKS